MQDLHWLLSADNLATVLSGTFASPEPDIRAAAAVSIGNLVASPEVLTAVASTTKPALVRGCSCLRAELPRLWAFLRPVQCVHESTEPWPAASPQRPPHVQCKLAWSLLQWDIPNGDVSVMLHNDRP